MLLYGNLDCERSWADDEAPERAYRRRALPPPVRAMLSSAATLMRALGGDGDRLWTPAPVAPARVPRAGLADVTLVSGEPSPSERVLPWGETREVAAVRTGAAAVGPAIAARANDRRWALPHGQLPHVGVIDSLAALEARARGACADVRLGDAWIVKAPFSAAGRECLRRRGAVLEADARTRAERMLALHGQLVFEPWVERVLDFGVCAHLDADGHLHRWPIHQQRCDRQGVFRAVATTTPALSDAERALIDATARRALADLTALGYHGPLSIDGFVWRDAGGARHVQPLCEINARLTFGRLAHALAGRAGHAIELTLGTGTPPGDVTPLLLPGDGDPSAAWLRAA